MRATHRISALLLLLAMLVCTVGCAKTREHIHCELGISLPREYEKVDIEQYDLAMSNGEAIVGLMRLSFEAALGEGIYSTHSPYAFAELYTVILGMEDTTVEEHGDVPYFTYTRQSSGGDYFYMATFYRTHYAYFIITFICPLELEGGYRVNFLSYTEQVFVLPEYT